MRGSNDRRIRREAISCGFNWDKLVLYLVQLHEARMRGAVLEVNGWGLKNIGAEVLPVFGLSEDGMTQRTGTVATFFRVSNFED